MKFRPSRPICLTLALSLDHRGLEAAGRFRVVKNSAGFRHHLFDAADPWRHDGYSHGLGKRNAAGSKRVPIAMQRDIRGGIQLCNRIAGNEVAEDGDPRIFASVTQDRLEVETAALPARDMQPRVRQFNLAEGRDCPVDPFVVPQRAEHEK
jgi:hypothetical protein